MFGILGLATARLIWAHRQAAAARAPIGVPAAIATGVVLALMAVEVAALLAFWMASATKAST